MSGELEDFKDKLQASEQARAAAEAQVSSARNLSAAREDEQPSSDRDDLAAVVQALQADLKVQILR